MSFIFIQRVHGRFHRYTFIKENQTLYFHLSSLIKTTVSMKKILFFAALCMVIITACVKEQTTPKSVNSAMMLEATYMDDFVLSAISVAPDFHKIDTGKLVTVFYDSVYSNFGGFLKHIGFQFSNSKIVYNNLRCIINTGNGTQRLGYFSGKTTINNGTKEFVYDDPNGIFLSPGWNTIVLKAKIFGNSGDSFHVTIPAGHVTYYSIDRKPGGVVGLPISTKGLRIR